MPSQEPQGRRRTWKGSAGKAGRALSLTAAAAAVRPWKAPSKHTTRRRPVAASAILRAFSLASAPLLEQNARHSPGGMPTASAARKASRSASGSRLVVKLRRRHCSASASPSPGSPAPRLLTQCPP